MLDNISRDLKFIVELSIIIRWLIAASLLVLPLFLQLINIHIRSIPTIVISGCMLLYNFLFFNILKCKVKKNKLGESADQKDYVIYKYIGRSQILLDYIALAMVLYFIGGLHTNLFYILLFHMTIGAIILSTQYMYGMVIVSMVCFFIMSFLELNTFIPYYHLYNMPNVLTYKSIIIETLSHAAILIGTIFMVSKLTNRIKIDNIKLIKTKDKLKENLKAIRALELRKSRFMRYSAHQLRSPLATIISALSVISKKMVPLDSERAFNLVSGAHDKAKSLLLIVNDLLELSRIREGREDVSLRDEIDFVLMVEGIIFSLNEEIYASKIEITRNYKINGKEYSYSLNYRYEEDFSKHKETLPTGYLQNVNKEHIREAVYNLVENAIKYSKNNGKITIDLSLDDYNKKYKFSIQDEGIGIEPDYIDDIFFEFVRSPNAKDYKQEGTGLGLAIVKEICDMHDADITVESELNKGTMFTVVFHSAKNPDRFSF